MGRKNWELLCARKVQAVWRGHCGRKIWNHLLDTVVPSDPAKRRDFFRGAWANSRSNSSARLMTTPTMLTPSLRNPSAHLPPAEKSSIHSPPRSPPPVLLRQHRATHSSKPHRRSLGGAAP